MVVANERESFARIVELAVRARRKSSMPEKAERAGRGCGCGRNGLVTASKAAVQRIRSGRELTAGGRRVRAFATASYGNRAGGVVGGAARCVVVVVSVVVGAEGWPGEVGGEETARLSRRGRASDSGC